MAKLPEPFATTADTVLNCEASVVDKDNKQSRMKILVTNDDGVYARGLWALVRELAGMAEVVVVAPDREQSGVGTALTIHQPLRVQQVNGEVPGVAAYSVSGTPGDSVIMGLSQLVGDRVDLVISGINPGPNLGDDALISGTVGGALHGYLHAIPAMAVSMNTVESSHVAAAARVTAYLARRITSRAKPSNILLNVNYPDVPLADIRGIKLTRLGSAGFANTFREGHDGRRKYYWLVLRKLERDGDQKSDVWALNNGMISITPLHVNLGGIRVALSSLYSGILEEVMSDRLTVREK